jgi:hypothetical protein
MRELLISGTCPKCWKKLFGAEDTSAETRGNNFDVDGEGEYSCESPIESEKTL